VIKPDDTLLVMCRSGGRSVIKNVYNSFETSRPHVLPAETPVPNQGERGACSPTESLLQEFDAIIFSATQRGARVPDEDRGISYASATGTASPDRSVEGL
jgi:hypothetical protein